MSLKHRLAKPSLVLLAVAVLTLAISACTFYKPGTFALTQPAGIGDVRVHFALCSELNEEDGSCVGSGDTEDFQSLLGIAVAKGAGAPATITATPVSGGPQIVYTRNDQVAQEIAAVSQETDTPWPPAGTEGIGYLSAPYPEEEVAREWTVDADFELPTAADGVPFAGPFPVSLWVGSREAGGGQSADRPVECDLSESTIGPGEALCEFAEAATLGTSDLKLAAAPQGSAFLGGKATLSFPLDFASTASSLPSFNLTATSTLPNAQVALASPTFSPGAPDATTHRSPLAFGTVSVTVPKNAKPGVYDVTLNVASATGGSVSRSASLSQVAKLEVVKAKVGLGKVKFNKAKGSATLFVKVPAAGTLIVAGKGLAKAKRKAGKAKTVKVPVKAKGKAKALLTENGKAKVKAKVTFTPTGAAPVVKTKSIVLKKSLGT